MMRTILLLTLVLSVSLPCCSYNDGDGTAWAPGSFDSNGERIYFTGTDAEGDRIRYRDGPDMGMMMMGGFLSCASCHGPDARGGEHIMHMQVMDAPDVRWSALQSEMDEHHEGGEDHHEEYDLGAFRKAVVDGKHPDGEALSRDMPRWDMGDDDLVDLAEYLRSLP